MKRMAEAKAETKAQQWTTDKNEMSKRKWTVIVVLVLSLIAIRAVRATDDGPKTETTWIRRRQ